MKKLNLQSYRRLGSFLSAVAGILAVSSVAIASLSVLLLPTEALAQPKKLPRSNQPELNKGRRMGHTVELGAALSLTGSAATIGNSVRKGMALAQQEVNTSGLPKIILRVEDTKSTVDGAISAVKNLIEVRKVQIILGPIGSGATLAVAPLTESSKVLLFTPTAVAEKIALAGDYVFRNRETARAHSAKAAEVLIERKITKVGIIAAQSANSLSYVDSFRVVYGEKGGFAVYYGEYEEHTTDMRTLARRAKEAGAEALYIVPTLGADAGRLVRQIRELEFSGTILGNELFESQEFLKAAGSAAEGVLYTFPGFDSSQGPGKRFANKFRKRFGKPADFHAANAYDAVLILADAIRSCGNIEVECIKAHILAIVNYSGAGGRTSFDPSGGVTKAVLLKKIVGKNFVIAPPEPETVDPDPADATSVDPQALESGAGNPKAGNSSFEKKQGN